jgi:branched-subunit amino acid transport protein
MISDHSVVYYLTMIFGMVVVTFGIRFVLYARADKIQMPEWVEQMLKFVPVAVLTAIIMPMILLPNQADSIVMNWQNPWLIGSLAAFSVGLLSRSSLLTIAVGLVIFFLSKWFFGS